jgi:hypothetical protein
MSSGSDPGVADLFYDHKKSDSIKLTFAVSPLFCGDERSSFQY